MNIIIARNKIEVDNFRRNHIDDKVFVIDSNLNELESIIKNKVDCGIKYFVIKTDNTSLTDVLEQLKDSQLDATVMVEEFLSALLRDGTEIKPFHIRGADAYPNLNFMTIVNDYYLPWNAIYSEYFWEAIRLGKGNVVLFDNHKFKLTEVDVAVLILTTRYLTKVPQIFTVSQLDASKLTKLFKTFTSFFHAVKYKDQLNLDAIISCYAYDKSFSTQKIKQWLSFGTSNFLEFNYQKILALADNLSDFMKSLNFHYFLRAMVGRWLTLKIEKKISHAVFNKYYLEFSLLEHSVDYVFVELFEFKDWAKIDQYLKEVTDIYNKQIA